MIFNLIPRQQSKKRPQLCADLPNSKLPKSKPRIGIVITSNPVNGGTYHYSISILQALAQSAPDKDYFVFYDGNEVDLSYIENRTNWIPVKYRDDANSAITNIARLLSLFLDWSYILRIAQGKHSILS